MIKNNNYKISEKCNKKIALLSDIHYSSIFKNKKFDMIINNLMKNKPDYICISGDIIDSNHTLDDKILKENLYNFFVRLSDISKVIVTIGNHDIAYLNKKKDIYSYNKEFFNSLNNINNVVFLDNEQYIDDNICFNGVILDFCYYYENNHESNDIFIDNYNSKNIKANLEKYNVMLLHSPINVLKDKTIEQTNIKDFDLILSGHMHNGMMFPLIEDIIKNDRGIIGPFRKIFPKYARGHIYKKINDKKVNLVVSGGITKLSKCAPKIFHPFNDVYPMSIEYIHI